MNNSLKLKTVTAVLVACFISFSALQAENEEHVPSPYFVDEVWAKVGELSCLKCHNDSGEAEDSGFILRETILLDGEALQTAHQDNFKAFA